MWYEMIFGTYPAQGWSQQFGGSGQTQKQGLPCAPWKQDFCLSEEPGLYINNTQWWFNNFNAILKS